MFKFRRTFQQEKGQIKNITVIDTFSSEWIKKEYSLFLSLVNDSNDKIETEQAKVKYDVVYCKVEYEAKYPFGEIKLLSGLVGYPIEIKKQLNK